MKYEKFVESITEIAAKSGEEVQIRFDNEDGKFTGIASNGVRFFGNSNGFKITVRWGSGHTAQFTPAMG